MKEFLNLIIPVLGGINWITDGFIFAIVLYAIPSGIWFLLKSYRRSRLIDGLGEMVREFNRPARPEILPNLKENFDRNGVFAEVWQEFEDSLITRQRDQNLAVVYKTDEASLFFSEERLLEQHLNLRYWNSVPALLVGMGILGTFVGLVWGLIPFSDINFTQTEEIRNAIQALLSGVSTAFITSVWGMFTSLLFNGLEKWRIGRASRAIVNLQRALDRLFTLTTQEEISFRQEDELTQQTAALRSFSTDLANDIKSAMDNIMSGRLENLHQSLAQLQDQSAEGRQEIIQELQKAPDAFSNAMAKQLAPSLNNLNTAVKELREQKEESSTDAIRQLVEEFQKSISGSIKIQMEELSETVGKMSEGLITLPEQMMRLIEGVQEQIDQTRKLLDATSEEQTGQMENMMDGMLNALQRAIDTQQTGLSETTLRVNEEMRQIAADIRNLLESAANRTDEHLTRRIADMETISSQSIQMLQSTISELQQSITSTASRTATESEAMTNRMRGLLESAANRTDEQLNQRMADMQTVSSQSIQALQSTIAQLQESITSTASQNATESEAMIIRMRELLESAANQTGDELNRRMVDMEAVSNQSIQTLEAAITELQQALTSTLDTQQQAIGNITSQTSAAFTESTDRMRQLVDQSVERLERVIQAGEQSVSTLLNQQGDQIRAINAQIANSQETLARGRDMLEQMNTTVTSVSQMIETTQTLSSQLMLGADRLETAGRQLTLASSAFNQENENYLSANRETTQQLQGTLVQSRELLNDFAQRFQTIDAGLNSIFAEIQRGLDAYASISHETITSYLGDFSSLVTNSVNSLAVSIEALRDLVEELSDSIERLRRR